MPNWSLSPWRYDDVQWGLTPCHGHCALLPAECLLDRIPLCLDCAGDQLDRAQAVELHRGMAELPPPWTR